MKIVVLAGGSGTRLWPLSRRTFPKQFLTLGGKESLLQSTLQRFLPTYEVEDIWIVTSQEYYHLVKEQARAVALDLTQQILVEPERKNTAPAIALAMKFLQEEQVVSAEETVLFTSSDHLISPREKFLEAVRMAESEVVLGSHLIFGIRPHKPETGYGYIQVPKHLTEKILPCERFVEKPYQQLAAEYVRDGGYLWNAGIFLFQIKTFLADIEKHCPAIGDLVKRPYQEMVSAFSSMPEISIDYALLEKSKNVKVCLLDVSWSDVGSWDGVYEVLEKDKDSNVVAGKSMLIDTKNCLIFGGKRLISTIGLEDLLVVETDDAIFIGKKGESEKVKTLVEELKQRGVKESAEHTTVYRPWGSYTVLEEGDGYKIKRISVHPKQRLSLQLHHHRSEHWVVVRGVAKAIIGSREHLLQANESVFVPKQEIHRLENRGDDPLEMIEVQVGDYLGEDDIVRLEDIYGRAHATLA